MDIQLFRTFQLVAKSLIAVPLRIVGILSTVIDLFMRFSGI